MRYWLQAQQQAASGAGADAALTAEACAAVLYRRTGSGDCMKRLLLILLVLLLMPVVVVLVIVASQIIAMEPDAVYELRGRYKVSADGKTYLVIEDDNGGGCGPLLVDGVGWKHAVSEKGEINPGSHRIECGGGIGIFVKQGTTYYFDYWGP